MQPFFETAAAHYIKPAWNVLNLGGEVAEDALLGFEGVLRVPQELAKQAEYFQVSEPGLIGQLKDRRLPPLVPDEFEKRAASKALTNGKDKRALLNMQKEVSVTVLEGVWEMQLHSLGWGNDDALLLAKALGLCRCLAVLDVSSSFQARNHITGDAAQLLATAVLGVATLEDFSGIPIKALREHGVVALDLTYRGIGVPGALVLAALLGGNPLVDLNLGANWLEAEGVAAICGALKEGCHEIAVLNMGANLDLAGAKSLFAMLAASTSLTCLRSEATHA